MKCGSDNMLINNSEYFDVLQDIKSKIKIAQHKVVLGVNKEMIILYWKCDYRK